MGNLKKEASDKLGIVKNIIDSLDNVFGQAPPYKEGEKAGKGISNVIDKIVDKILPK